MLLLQGIMGQNLLPFPKEWSNVSYTKGNMKGSTEAPFLSL